jgi:uncharacterized BrkB/YihY/UPF0761 family membrane protein
VLRPFATLSQIVEARVRYLGRRAALRGGLVAGCAAAALACLVFLLAAMATALAERYGAITALVMMAGLALIVVLALLLALMIDARRHRRLAARRMAADRQFYQAAALSMVPRARPSRSTLGLGLVALGALLVLMRRGDD